jgi:hypothetical protein
MPARIRRDPEVLMIILEREGEEPATRQARDRHEALLFAIADAD